MCYECISKELALVSGLRSVKKDDELAGRNDSRRLTCVLRQRVGGSMPAMKSMEKVSLKLSKSLALTIDP